MACAFIKVFFQKISRRGAEAQRELEVINKESNTVFNEFCVEVDKQHPQSLQ